MDNAAIFLRKQAGKNVKNCSKQVRKNAKNYSRQVGKNVVCYLRKNGVEFYSDAVGERKLKFLFWSNKKGALTEQYVLQQLISDTPYTPYYYGTEKATFEQDFMIQKESMIIPVEVKAETNIRSQSLKVYCDKFYPEKAVRFSALKYMDQDWMVNIPLYAVCNL